MKFTICLLIVSIAYSQASAIDAQNQVLTNDLVDNVKRVFDEVVHRVDGFIDLTAQKLNIHLNRTATIGDLAVKDGQVALQILSDKYVQQIEALAKNYEGKVKDIQQCAKAIESQITKARDVHIKSLQTCVNKEVKQIEDFVKDDIERIAHNKNDLNDLANELKPCDNNVCLGVFFLEAVKEAGILPLKLGYEVVNDATHLLGADLRIGACAGRELFQFGLFGGEELVNVFIKCIL